MSKDKNNNNFVDQILLKAFFDNEQQKWDELRNRESEILSIVQREYSEYFSALFKTELPTYTIKQGTPLFRARCIKSTDESKLGVNISDVIESFYRVILSDEEISLLDQKVNAGPLRFSLQHLFMLKAQNMKAYSADEQERIDSLINENSISKVYGFQEKDSRVPPQMFRKAGRLNTVSDAFLYVAFDKDTAIHEMRPSIGQRYSVAEFQLNKELVLACFTDKIYSDVKYSPLWSLIDKISEPNTDNTEVFYHITQTMAHVIKEQGYDGIVYNSALCKGKYNVLLFDESHVDFISSEITEILDVRITYTTILPFSKDYNSPIELSLVHKRKDIDFTVHAFATITSEGIRVLKGSTIAPINDLIHSLLTNDNKKKRLECKVENNILQEDVLFESVSGAAQFVTGKSLNGKTSWKTKDGKTIRDLENKIYDI